MSENKQSEPSLPELPEPMVDYVVHQYGLTRDQARAVVNKSAGDRALVDAEAGQLKSKKESVSVLGKRGALRARF